MCLTSTHQTLVSPTIRALFWGQSTDASAGGGSPGVQVSDTVKASFVHIFVARFLRHGSASNQDHALVVHLVASMTWKRPDRTSRTTDLRSNAYTIWGPAGVSKISSSKGENGLLPNNVLTLSIGQVQWQFRKSNTGRYFTGFPEKVPAQMKRGIDLPVNTPGKHCKPHQECGPFLAVLVYSRFGLPGGCCTFAKSDVSFFASCSFYYQALTSVWYRTGSQREHVFVVRWAQTSGISLLVLLGIEITKTLNLINRGWQNQVSAQCISSNRLTVDIWKCSPVPPLDVIQIINFPRWFYLKSAWKNLRLTSRVSSRSSPSKAEQTKIF